jgi:transcriptional regulator with XRE-family HTH domain
MGDSDTPDVLVERLHLLRARSGLSTQQLATRCGIPKSSMESYMRLKDAKRPGIDALISISNAMNVSLDWLAGRVDDSNQPLLYSRDYALGCFNVVLSLLDWLRKAYSDHPERFVSETEFAGREDAEIAARSMAEFIDAMHTFSANSEHWGPDRRDFVQRLEEVLKASETGN